VAIVINATQFSQAQDAPIHPYLENKHLFSVGAIHQEVDGEVRASVKGLPEVGIDLGDLGLDNSDTSWMFEYSYRISDRWEVNASAYVFDGSSSLTAKDSFNFDGQEFKAGMKLTWESRVLTRTLCGKRPVYQGLAFE